MILMKREIEKYNNFKNISIALHTLTLVVLFIAAGMLYSVSYKLDQVDRGSVEFYNILQAQVSNQRECIQNQDWECPTDKYHKYEFSEDR